MAQQLTINLKNKSFHSIPVKVERSKLYGWTEMRAVTPEGEICLLGGLNFDGTTILTPGQTKNAMIGEDGRWLDRCDTMAVNHDGSPAKIIESSFDSGISLCELAHVEDLLDLNVTAVYQIYTGDINELVQAIGEDIYATSFLYRPGYEANKAFVLANAQGVFLLTGTTATFDPIGIDQEACFDEFSDDENPENEEIDFSMF